LNSIMKAITGSDKQNPHVMSEKELEDLNSMFKKQETTLGSL